MENIQSVIELSPGRPWEQDGDKQVREVFSGERRLLLEIRLRNSALLQKHKAAEPITVLCLDGSGTFYAGAELGDAQKMKAGTLVTLEADVFHQVSAEPDIHILVTKFKSDRTI